MLSTFLKTELSVPERLIPVVTQFYREEELPKNHFLVQKGQRCHKMCLIQEGYFRFFSYSEKKSITHWIFGKNQLVTDIASFLSQQPAKWNIQTLTETRVFSISSSNHSKLSKEIPEWDHYEKLFLVKLMSALENRVYTFLSMSSEERYQYLFQSDSDMFNELPLQYLASMLRMTPETLSRIRKKHTS